MFQWTQLHSSQFLEEHDLQKVDEIFKGFTQRKTKS